MEDGWVKVVKMKVDVVLLGAHSSSFEDLHRHGSADYISRSQILSRRGVAGHEALSQAIPEDSSLSSAALGHEATSSIDAGGVELHKL